MIQYYVQSIFYNQNKQHKINHLRQKMLISAHVQNTPNFATKGKNPQLFSLFGPFCFYLLIFFALLDMPIANSAPVNLMCNTDFQSYPTTSKLSLNKYSIFYSYYKADKCWYPSGSSIFQIKMVGYYGKNRMCELMQYFSRYKLCQNVGTLTIGKTYLYEFDIGIHPNVNISRCGVHLDGNVIQYFYKNYTTAAVFTRAKGNFTAKMNKSSFCVSSTQKLLPNAIAFDQMTTLVDNFLVYQDPIQDSVIQSPLNSTSNFTNFSSQSTSLNLSSQYFNFSESQNSQMVCQNRSIQFRSTIDDINGIVTLTSTITLDALTIQQLKQTSIIKISGQIQKNLTFSSSAELHMIIQININRAYNLRQLQFDIETKIATPYFCYIMKIELVNSLYLALPMSQNQKAIVRIAEKISDNTIKYFFDGYGQIRVYFCSFLVANFISFFNIIILYNFLLISTQNSFSYENLRKLADIYFNSSYSTLQILIQLFKKIGLDINLNFNSFAQTSNQKEKIAEKYDNFEWFNLLGMTYNFLMNCFSSLFTFALLFLKFCLIFFLRKLVRLCFPNCFAKSKKPTQIIIAELICTSSTLTISALSTILSTGDQKFTEKINTSLQALCLGSIMLLPFLSWISIFGSIERKKQKWQQKKHFSSNVRWKNCFLLCEYALHIIIPCLVVVRSKIPFFILTSFSMLTLLFCYIRGFCSFTLYRKMHYGFICLALLLHHICFFFFFCMSLVSIEVQISTAFFSRLAGIIVIFTVLVGSLVELMDCLVKLGIMIFKSARYAYKSLKTQKDRHNQAMKLQKQNSGQFIQKQKDLVPVDYILQNSNKPLKIIMKNSGTNIKNLQNLTHFGLRKTNSMNANSDQLSLSRKIRIIKSKKFIQSIKKQHFQNDLNSPKFNIFSAQPQPKALGPLSQIPQISTIGKMQSQNGIQQTNNSTERTTKNKQKSKKSIFYIKFSKTDKKQQK